MNQFKDTLYILYGSRTGNAKAVAVLAYEYAQSLGYAALLQDMQNMDYQDLSQVENLLVVVSTHGEGEPPVQAEGFYEFLHSHEIDKVKTKFAVLGLGDSSYRYYCQTGKDIHQRLNELGGTDLMEVESCDIDFEETAKNWVHNVIEVFKSQLPVLNTPNKNGFVFELKLDNDQLKAYRAELLEKKMLTDENSSKKVLHVSLSLKNSGIDYLPGDAIGIYGTNSRLFVDKLLKTLGFDKAVPIATKNETRLLKDVLIHDYELTLITTVVIRKYAEIVKHSALYDLLKDDALLDAYATNHDIMDLVTDYPGDISVKDFLSILRPLSQRLYSVASSANAIGEKADITVKIIENKDEKRIRNGVCSSFLWHRLDVGDKVPITLETIAKFRLPEDDNQAVIMIGAGTGIAPFRAFLQERATRKANGKNWLIFGERNRASDFLYEGELQSWKNSGLLTKLNTAFSRDQKEKFYANHILEEEAETLLKWLKEGATIYVCGSKDNLAVAVRESLIKILTTQENLDRKEALARFETLKSNKKYQEEVY